MQVALQSEACCGIDRGIGVVNHLLQIVGTDTCYLIGVNIVLMVCLIKIYLSQEGGSGSLGGTTLILLRYRQHGIGLFQIVDNLLPTFVVAILRVREIIVVFLLHIWLVDKRNLLEQTLQLEVSIGTQELHLCRTLLNLRIVLVGS